MQLMRGQTVEITEVPIAAKIAKRHLKRLLRNNENRSLKKTQLWRIWSFWCVSPIHREMHHGHFEARSAGTSFLKAWGRVIAGLINFLCDEMIDTLLCGNKQIKSETASTSEMQAQESIEVGIKENARVL
jgi:hypothetical protein